MVEVPGGRAPLLEVGRVDRNRFPRPSDFSQVVFRMRGFMHLSSTFHWVSLGAISHARRNSALTFIKHSCVIRVRVRGLRSRWWWLVVVRRRAQTRPDVVLATWLDGEQRTND